MKSLCYRAIGLIVALGILTSACAAPKPGPVSTQPPVSAPQAAPAPQLSDWDKVLAAAKKEGAVTFYTTWGVQIASAVREGMKQYGIKADVIGGQGSDLEVKITTEQRAKAYVADVFATGWTNNVNIFKAGLVQPVDITLPVLAEKDVWRVQPARYVPTHGTYVTGTFITPPITVNTDFVARGEIRGWQDVLDPKWRDKIVMTDPRTGSGPAATGLGNWMTVLGEDYWRKLAAQRPILQVKYDLAVSQVALGEKPVGLFIANNLIVNALAAGAPLHVVPMKEGDPYMQQGINLVKNGPHPNAALVLLNWYFSKEGQAALAKAQGFFSVRNDLREDWLAPEIQPQKFTFIEPAFNLNPEVSKKAAEFGNQLFGAR